MKPIASADVTRREFLGTVMLATAGAAVGVAAEPAPPRYQIGCYTRPWDQHDYRVALDAIAEAGYKHAGLMTSKTGTVITVKTTPDEAAAVGAEVKQRGLKVVSLWGGQFSTNDELKRLVDNSAACGCPNLLLGGTTEERSAAYYKIVADCCDYAASKGVGLSVKPHGGNNATGAQCRQIIEKVNHRNFRIWYDPGNIFYYSDGQRDPVTDVADVDGLVAGMSVKDFLPPKNVAVTPGSGKVDFAKVFARLKHGGFTHGPLVVECLAPGDVAPITAEARKARQLLENLTA